MSSFKNETVNTAFEGGVINIIIAHLTKCGTQMRMDCVNSHPLENNEDKITNRLVSTYLNAEPNNFRYEPQSLEHYDEETNCYIGRTDIKVISGDYFRDSQAYYIIECKCIDGTSNLNRKYVTEGVARFLIPTAKPKYSSYYAQNIMLGYVIRSINIPENTAKIKKLQNQILENVTANDFLLLCHAGLDYYVYTCQYQSDKRNIELRHLFYDLSAAMCN
ncbi:MAG: hypothetical protein LBL26_08975 [Peptococcaceae bacterium]|jgi:hypothetical protein|nr:hypothetical protein [Peptococcaceae bacterium]